MAGAGVRLFTAGSILTAQQVNEYLMDQTVSVFNDAAARDAAFGGVGEPVLSEGRLAYLKSDDNIYVYNGSAWVELQLDIPGTAGQTVIYDGSGNPVARTLSGDVTVNSSGVTAIGSGVIVNADVSASAAIALSKLASATAGQVVVHNATGVPTATTITGDVTVNSSGATAIGSGVIVNADVNANAEIALSKLATSTSSQLASIISDETGSGALVFGTSPTITPAAGTTTNAHNGAGYMGMPQTAPASSMPYTLLASDAGKHIYVTTSGTVTIPANSTTAFPVGTTIVIVSANGVTTTVSITTDTLRLANSTSTGNRTIASNGMATLLKLTSTLWVISGNGVT